jgi:hypothetical protein
MDYGPIATARGLMGAIHAVQTIPPCKTLCVGSGNAYEAVCFKQCGFDVYTLDYFAPPVRLLNGRQVIGQGQALPFKNNSFGLVFSAECIEHIPEDEIDQFMLELKRTGKIFRFTIDDEDDPPYHTHLCIHDINWWKEKFTEWGYSGELIKPQIYNLYLNSGQITSGQYGTRGFRFEGSKVISQ